MSNQQVSRRERNRMRWLVATLILGSLGCTSAVPAADPPRGLVVRPVFVGAEKAIRAKLADSTSFELSQVPLKDVVDFLHTKTKVHFALDLKALESIQVEAGTIITVQVRETSLKNHLNQLTRSLGAAWLVADEGILITSPEVAEKRLVRRVYDAQDWLDDAHSLEELTGALNELQANEGMVAEGDQPDTQLLVPLSRPRLVPYEHLLLARGTEQELAELEQLLETIGAGLANAREPVDRRTSVGRKAQALTKAPHAVLERTSSRRGPTTHPQ